MSSENHSMIINNLPTCSQIKVSLPLKSIENSNYPKQFNTWNNLDYKFCIKLNTCDTEKVINMNYFSFMNKKPVCPDFLKELILFFM
jgi:hypothetical protein